MSRAKTLRAVAPTAILILAATFAGPAGAADAATSTVTIARAWTPAQTQVGVDTPLFMTVANSGSEADTLVRARCATATFTEFRVIDRGEGVPSPRLVKAIPIPAGPTSLEPDGARIVLLQTTEALPAGAQFTCTLTFRNAGPVEVAVKAGEPTSAAAH